MNHHYIARAQKSWRDVMPAARAREQRKGRGHIDKTPEQAAFMADLEAKVTALLRKAPHTFHQIQCAVRPPAYETDLRAALKNIGAVRDGRIYSLPPVDPK